MITFEQAEQFREQELADQLAWFRANASGSERELGIYSAAFSAGYRKAMGACALHGAPAGISSASRRK